MSDSFFDFSPGAQIPLSGSAGQTDATNALASAAYRDDPVDTILKANSEWHQSQVKKGISKLFEPNLGEAFSRAVQVRMLGGARNALVQSFGTEPQTVVEHCLAATRIRKERDTRLTVITLLFGVIFLPGLLIWLGIFQVRRSLTTLQDKRQAALGTAVAIAAAGLLVIFLLRMPFTGFWALYLRAMLVAPVIGWLWARQISEKYAKDLRSRWNSLLAGGGLGAKIPEAVPKNPNEAAAEQLRQGLARLTAEQHSNSVFYAGPKGILGMGTRWGHWYLAEELQPAPGEAEFNPFRSWDVIRAIHDELRMLERGSLHTGGLPKPDVKHWVVSHIDEGADEITRPTGEDVESFQVKGHEIQRISNQNHFGKGDRHYLGVQFVDWDGHLVLTMMVTVTVLRNTLRIEVTGHALGPVHGLFRSKPKAKKVTVNKTVRFWETKDKIQPLIDASEVVRLAVRAPLTWTPPILDFFGGKLVLPEPFGLRHVWAGRPWRHRFMADDAMRAAVPVMRAAHSAALRVLAENNVDVERFDSRASFLSNAVQDPMPRKDDVYDA